MSRPAASSPTLALPTQLSDESVVERVCAGEVEIFEVLMRRYNQRLFRVAQSILNDELEAEDVLQETYLRAFVHLESFEARAAFSTWLTKIAVHEALGRRRKRNRFRPSEDSASHLDRAPASAPSPERRAGSRELRRALEAAIQALRPSYRVVFVLRELEGMNTRETAEVLGLSRTLVKVRLHRARRARRASVDDRRGCDVGELYGFYLERCDRVVAAVFERLGAVEVGSAS